jgi:hypothetical protein
MVSLLQRGIHDCRAFFGGLGCISCVVIDREFQFCRMATTVAASHILASLHPCILVRVGDVAM